MTEHDALQDRLKSLKEAQEAGFEPTEARIASVLHRGKRHRAASIAGAGLGVVALAVLVWSFAFPQAPNAPDVPPAFGEDVRRVSAGYEISSGDVTFKGGAASCGKGDFSGDVAGPYCRLDVSYSNSVEGILLRPGDIYLIVDGVRYDPVNELNEDWEDFYGPNYLFEEPLDTHPAAALLALFAGLPKDLRYPLELHLQVPGGEPVIIEFPECAVATEGGTSITTPCD